MFDLLWLIPALPFTAFGVLALFGSRLTRSAAAIAGTLPVAVSAIVAFIISAQFIAAPPVGHAYTQTLRTWVQVGGFNPAVSFLLDPLSIVMVLVITFVSFLILIYSTRFMAGDDGFARFFAYMNLFVGSMLVLVLAEDLLLLYLGWEGVGLCSYLLIGFWYREEENARSAFKAFLVTRIGDASFAVGLFLIFHSLGTLNIQEAMARASQQWVAGSALATAAAGLLLGGAVGKSAQLPLQTWLPDAMAGPTPVSALIHAATMVTAGVYLIARTHVFFELAPVMQHMVAIIGAATLLIAGTSAFVQRDIKRILAYSTMSQIGYMFLALGAGAWMAAMFHFMIHAFFKALLFLGAGVIIQALHEEHDIFSMGGLKEQLPVTFWTFLIGCASLSAVPFVTGGYYSKDLILLEVWNSPQGGSLLFIAGLAGALITSVYSFRLFFIVFFGEPNILVKKTSAPAMTVPLVILAVPAVIGGLVEMPGFFGAPHLFSRFVGNALPGFKALSPAPGTDLRLFVLSCMASLGGIFLAYLMFLRKPAFGKRLADSTPGRLAHRFFLAGWGFDRVYDVLIVEPFVRLSRMNKDDVLDHISRGIAWLVSFMHGLLGLTQSGSLRWYAMAIATGAVIFIGMVILL
jgi:NADH-quinone oxidoreductase subunit L